MDNAFRPAAEWLEGHVLLSSVAAGQFVSSTSPIVETLSTDKTIYKVGQPIEITLSETNTTGGPIVSPSAKGLESFTASQKFKDVWKSKGSMLAAPSVTLQPGQTHTITVIWNGHANVGSHSRSTPLSGTIQIDSTLANNSATIAIDPRHGRGSTAGVTMSVPNEPLELT